MSAKGNPKANRVYADPAVDKTELSDFCNPLRKFWKKAATTVKTIHASIILNKIPIISGDNS